MARFKPGEGGRPKGVKNKATRDIRAFLQETVDWNARRDNLVKLAEQGNVKAEELLWQYGFGKPVEIQIAPMTVEHKADKDGKPMQHEHVHSLDKTATNNLLTLAKALADRS